MPNVLPRDRLLKKLDSAVEYRLTLLCAPPGYGKTTLTWQFAQRHPAQTIWYAVEAWERDFAEFRERLTGTLCAVLPRLEPLITPNPSADPDEWAAALANAMRTVVKDDLFLILDDVHTLVGDRRFERWLRAFIAVLPARVHVIVISRVLPSLPLAEMVARREVQAIGQQELRFTADEIDALAQNSEAAPMQPAILDRMEGWAAGIVLALQPLPTEITQAFASGENAPEALFESLAERLLDAQPPNVRDFLLTTSVLTRFTPESAAAVLGVRDAAALLDEVLQKNLFVTRLAGGVSYHGLFRAVLQRRLSESAPERSRELHLKAAAWYTAHDRMSDAFDHYLAAGELAQAAAQIESAILNHYQQGKYETLLRWQESFAQAGIESDKLLYAAATIHMERLEFEQAAAELDRCEAIAQAHGHHQRSLEVWLQRARLHMHNGHYLAAVAQAEKVIAAVEAAPDAAQAAPDNLHGRALRALGFAYFRLGNLTDAVRLLESALPLARAYADKLALANLLQDMQVVYLRAGRADDAAACLQEVVAVRRTLGGAVLLAGALNDLGYHYHQHGDYAHAFSTFQEGLRVIAPLGSRRIESYLLWSMGDLQRDLGAFDDALPLYQRALTFTGIKEPNLRCAVLISMAALYRWQGRFEDAITTAEEAYALAEAHEMTLEMLQAETAYWAAHGFFDQPDAALSRLNALADRLTSQRAHAEAAHAHMICAGIAALHGGRAVSTPLTAAIQSVRQGGQAVGLQAITAEIVQNPPLDQAVLQNPPRYTALVERVNALRGSQLNQPTVIQLEEKTSADYVYSLRVQTLGAEKVERDGVPILPGEWRATAARELFFYLMFVGKARRETISLDFWPDHSAEKVRSNFHTTLYRVRQALGENVVIYQGEQYSINGDLDIWCDAHAFEKLVERAQNLSLRDARTEDLFRRAVDLYQGDFLPLLEAEWIASTRERLRDLYLESLIGLGYCAEARADHRQSISLFKQALKVDPFREDIHRAIMAGYAARGERQKIYHHLQHMMHLFRQELAIEPTRETVAYARKLMSS
ncbi:MAG: tetratricopeptide repeat protein [bacterium]|nr:tetratricopeptide repeat protein [bacterium]